MGKQVVVQSFMNHRLTVNFRDEKNEVIRVGTLVKTVTVPARQEAPQNILILTPQDFEAVKYDLQDRIEMGQRGGVVILDSIPSGFWNPTQRVAEAEGKLQAAEAQFAGSQVRIGQLEADVEALKDKLRVYGWKGD